MNLYIAWLNGNAGRKVTVEAADELRAAQAFWAWDNRTVEQPPVIVWVRLHGTERAVGVQLDPTTGHTTFATIPQNRQDD